MTEYDQVPWNYRVAGYRQSIGLARFAIPAREPTSFLARLGLCRLQDVQMRRFRPPPCGLDE
jgi:hypothetical protein